MKNVTPRSRRSIRFGNEGQGDDLRTTTEGLSGETRLSESRHRGSSPGEKVGRRTPPRSSHPWCHRYTQLNEYNSKLSDWDYPFYHNKGVTPSCVTPNIPDSDEFPYTTTPSLDPVPGP